MWGINTAGVPTVLMAHTVIGYLLILGKKKKSVVLWQMVLHHAALFPNGFLYAHKSSEISERPLWLCELCGKGAHLLPRNHLVHVRRPAWGETERSASQGMTERDGCKASFTALCSTEGSFQASEGLWRMNRNGESSLPPQRPGCATCSEPDVEKKIWKKEKRKKTSPEIISVSFRLGTDFSKPLWSQSQEQPPNHCQGGIHYEPPASWATTSEEAALVWGKEGQSFSLGNDSGDRRQLHSSDACHVVYVLT